jgi:CRP-like cAMP-binding protein
MAVNPARRADYNVRPSPLFVAAMIDDLRNAPLLCRLSDEQLERVRRGAVQRRLDEGELLFAQGAAAERFYLVQAGQMRLFRLAPDGSEKIIEIVSPGQTFAEALMFLDTPRYPVSAAALAPTRLIAIDARDFAAMLRGSVETCFHIMGAMSQRLRSLIGEIDELTLHSAKGRVARYLLAHCPEERRALVLDVPKGVLASRLSIKPETFSRVFKQLMTDGVIDVYGAHVTVRDRDALGRVAAD